jgi:pimeloyl-ACP methyl ester carboxylesterase
MQEARLTVPGAELYYTVQGTGPTLLVLQGGAADADGSNALAAQLAHEFRVVSLDRRGLSRSKVSSPVSEPLVERHAADALALLDALAPEPAFVLGSSIGALIGLAMLFARPERVRRLIAHEPPLSQVLNDAQRTQLMAAQLELEAAYNTAGGLAALGKFMVALGVNPFDREPDAPLAAPGPRHAANVEWFLQHDAPAVRQYRLDLDALSELRERLCIAVGANSRATLHAAAALALAERLGVPAHELPGGHGAYATHPRAFASALRALLR